MREWVKGVVEVTRVTPLKEGVAFATLKGEGYLGKVKILGKGRIERFSKMVGKGKVLVLGALEPRPDDFKQVFLLLRDGYPIGGNGEGPGLGVTLEGVFFLGPWELRYTSGGTPFLQGYVRFRTPKGMRGSLPFVYFGGEELPQMVEGGAFGRFVYVSGNLEETSLEREGKTLRNLRVRASTLVPVEGPIRKEEVENGEVKGEGEADDPLEEFPEELPF